MQEIPKTFCPAKWDELLINAESNMVYSCCKSVPTTIGSGDMLENIKKQRENLLNGIQDPACNYCWLPEKIPGTKSRRHIYLEKMESSDISKYVDGTANLKYIELNIGNQCNFQCTYCKPNFSSKWENDVRKKPYKLYTDRFAYEIPKKNKDVLDKNLKLLEEHKNIHKVTIIGGEPLYNKNFFTLIKHIDSKWLGMATNLSCNKETIDRLINETKKFEHVLVNVSLDATGGIAEFARHGLNFNQWKENFEYLLKNKPDYMVVQVISLFTSVTVRDIENFAPFMLNYLDQTKWHVSFCIDPKIQGFSTLPDKYKPAIINCLESLKSHPVSGLDGVISAIKVSKFNATMHNELVSFMNDFAKRKNIEIPICLN